MKPKGVLLKEAIPRQFDGTPLSTMKLVDVARALDSATSRSNIDRELVRQLLTRILAGTTTSALGVLGRPEQMRLVNHLNRSLERIVGFMDLGEALSEGYYRDTTSLRDIIRKWQSHGDKLYDDAQPVMIPIRELWPHREYTWTRDDARVTPETWDKMERSLRQSGWKRGEPLYFEVGRQGGAKVGEGNHRLAIARDISRIRAAPVRFIFRAGVVRKDAQRPAAPRRPRRSAPSAPTNVVVSPEEEKRIQDILDLL